MKAKNLKFGSDQVKKAVPKFKILSKHHKSWFIYDVERTSLTSLVKLLWKYVDLAIK